jgi:urea carboxylase
VLYGPHGAPDFFTADDVDTFFATDWEVHYNSSRTGVRLLGPRPQWARKDGGEAGLHPSNIHDNAYAIGAIDFTGDMPVILGPDGPSLGGFVCPAVVVDAELWKLGQLRPGDTVRFNRLSLDQALDRSATVEAALATLSQRLPSMPTDDATAHPTPVILDDPARVEHSVPAMVVRQAGDRYLLVEFGPLVLDIELRLRVHVLMQALRSRIDAGSLPGILDMTPGIRSLQLHFDPVRVSRETLLRELVDAEAGLPAVDDIVVPSRTVYLPLSWDDPQTKLAIEKYTQSVRPDAPWCPSNIEFIRRINGLDSIDDVFKVVFEASYLVLGLGDVYLGAPVATPVDPRHRLVTTKYNPARTWTPENAVGIGGAYLCVYGMEGPGGYQFVGRTLQMWNRWRHGEGVFTQPWLLRFFDQIRFVPVSHDELLRIRAEFPHGGYALRIEDSTFSLRDYRYFLAENAGSIGAFKARQQTAFDAERERWIATGQDVVTSDADLTVTGPESELHLPAGGRALATSVPGSVWKVAVEEGQRVKAGEVLMVIESMKMEFNLLAPADATVHKLMCQQGAPVSAGQNVLVLVDTEALAA